MDKEYRAVGSKGLTGEELLTFLLQQPMAKLRKVVVYADGCDCIKPAYRLDIDDAHLNVLR